MKIFSTLFLILTLLTSCVRQNVLVLTERGGQHESFTAAGLEWLEETGKKMGFSITEINSTDPIDKEYLDKFELIIQLDFPPYTWTDKAADAFISYIEEGKGGWIGFHHATLLGEFDGYPMWEWFSDFMGGIRYRNYIAECVDGEITIEDPAHPVMKDVTTTFIIPEEEWYIYDMSPRENVKVLASVDEDSYSPSSEIRMGDHPVVWVNESVKAKNVYFQFGHSQILYENEDFVRMFRNSLEWMLDK